MIYGPRANVLLDQLQRLQARLDEPKFLHPAAAFGWIFMTTWAMEKRMSLNRLAEYKIYGNYANMINMLYVSCNFW